MSENASRNAIFTADQPQTNMPSISMAEQVRVDFGLDVVPAELAPLPSCGVTYPPESALHKCEVVDIKAMTAREEDILTSRALLKSGKVITELVKSCLINKRINVQEMLSGDRNAVMVAIRATGYGVEYEAEIKCEECEEKSKRTFDLSALQIKKLQIEPRVEGVNAFEFTLPITHKKVLFKFLTVGDEEEIATMQERQKKHNLSTSDTNVTTSLLYSLLSVESVSDRAKLAQFVKNMGARDSLALRNYIKDNEPGISMKQFSVCPSCNHDEEVNIPMGVNFFWPSSGR